MSDNENSGGSPVDRSKRPRFEDEEWDSDYERDGHDDRHPKRLAVPDPETKAPHFVPTEDKDSSGNSRRKKWEEKDGDSEDERLEDIKIRPSCSKVDDNANTKDESISIRSLVGTKDAGVIIGRGGKNVSDIRELSNARVTISEIVPGAYERILTVSGPVNAVAKAYSLVGEKILSEHTQPEESNADGEQILTIKLLVPDNKMGTLIGKGGVVIKSIQDESGSRLNASEEPLPMSSERTISIQGTPTAVQHAIQRIAKILMDYSERAPPNTIQYRPTPQMNSRNSSSSGGNGGYMNMRSNNSHAAMGYGGMMPMGGMPMSNPSQFYYQGPAAAGGVVGGGGGYGSMPNSRQPDYGMGAMGMNGMGMGMGGMASLSGMVAPSQAQQIFIPNEMVGCIIGKGGSKINEIRQLSGSHIKIADSHGDANERLVTITGTPESNQMALYLLYSRLESEKNRLGLRQN
ncbi:uncharacterized protein EV154DRAFT_480176 [Mucor mucedo]|uniref:uncharacterized protein n=1 Tax=Mucor mucedo TaxID=29922 RepID=UPI00221F2176|nr:uncharacterized protein EV154DRAFT_480176 [Mucor mucedo]KAI7892687.1 hypothetical protein EV154DRAFT_480176 [Mucor mucedo]